ncbi:MAG: hypothetical protein K5872_22880 [Rhizobiaceae bacterium]|nr:hypothetical protein [Rhizobiaceae bacterium]MCV0409068.1 hypothetical protein [Rhizobiaceae bacterium]
MHSVILCAVHGIDRFSVLSLSFARECIISSTSRLTAIPDALAGEVTTIMNDETVALQAVPDTKRDLIIAYCRMINSGIVGEFAAAIPDDFHYASQYVLSEITSKNAFLSYISAKLDAIRRGGVPTFAEVGEWGGEACAVLAQGDKDRLVAVVMAGCKDGLVHRLDLCIVPSPHDVERSGLYPS